MVSFGEAWHSKEEESEEALATRLKIPAQVPPQPPGQLTQAILYVTVFIIVLCQR